MFKKQIVMPLIMMLVILSGFIIQPIFVSPDEGDHLARAYTLAHGDLFLITPENKDTGGWIDRNMMRFIMQNGGAGNTSSYQYLAQYGAEYVDQPFVWSDDKFFKTMPGTNYYTPLIYIPQTVGIFVSAIFTSSIPFTYYVSCFFVLLTSLGILLYSNKILRINPLILGILLLPTQIVQFYSSSIDAVSLCLSILTCSIFMRLMTDKNKYNNLKNFLLLSFSILIVTTSRTHMLPFLLIPLVLAVSLKSKKYSLSFIVLLLLNLSWIYVVLKTTVDHRTSMTHSTAASMIYYLFTNPAEMVSVFFNTVTNIDYLLKYRDEFILIGYQAYYLVFPLSIVLFMLVALTYSLKELKRDMTVRIVLFCISLLSILLIFFSLLVGWTPIGSGTIEGVQGRYFTIPLVVFSYVLIGIDDWLENSKKLKMVTQYLLIFIFILTSGLASYCGYHRKYSVYFRTYQVSIENQYYGASL